MTSKQISLILYWIFLLVIIFLYPLSIGQYSKPMLGFTLILALLSIIIFALSKEKNQSIQKQYFRPIIFFLIGYCIVFFQLYVDILLGNVNANNSFLFVNSMLINQAALLSCGGLITFLLGYLIFSNQKIRSRNTVPKVYSLNGLSCILLFFLLLFIYYNGSNYIMGSYSQEFMEEKAGTMAAYSEILFLSTYFSIVILNCRRCRIEKIDDTWLFVKSYGILFYISIVTYMSFVLLSGDRGPILVILLTFLFSYVVGTLKKIKLTTYIFIVIAGAFCFTILGIARSIDDDKPMVLKVYLALQDQKPNFVDKSIIPITSELAASVRTLHYSMSYVPEKHPYLFGSFQIRDILGTVPFSNSVTKNFLDPHFKYKSSAYFATWIHQGEKYSYGDGSSINADLYLSFGVLGVWIGLFLLGILFRRIDLIVFSTSINNVTLFILTLAFIIMGTCLRMSRGTFFEQLRYVVFTFVIIIIYDSVMKNLKLTKTNHRIK
ncbi:MAG: O-antigen polysaccharide polymerase Wzy [Dysgonomonas sp.]